ncbi:CRE-LIN-24 protein [Aphelenchoides besseyi]|nr:CRE-LIN-24 protein [Aphelenchoides besseyi]
MLVLCELMTRFYTIEMVPPPDVEKHVDVDFILEDYAWRMFRDMLGIKKAGVDGFKHLDREEAEFIINRKRLILHHSDPEYSSMQLSGAKPNTIFKSVFTNKTSQPQAYSLKTERTTESVCGVVREQGFMFGAEAELTLKTPCEIAELKTGFKHEVHFNNLNENVKTEALTWGVDSNIMVPAGAQTEAGIVIEEMNYSGSYRLVSTLTGMVTISVRRFYPLLPTLQRFSKTPLKKYPKRLQGVSIENNKVKLLSKGSCHFQFAMKQYIELNELSTPRDLSREFSRLNAR